MRVVKCPWCHEGVEVDPRRLDGGVKALDHVRRCPVLRASANGGSHG